MDSSEIRALCAGAAAHHPLMTAVIVTRPQSSVTSWQTTIATRLAKPFLVARSRA
jgi:hypothetical protein